MEDFFEQIKLFLPKYLTPTEQRQLFKELSDFPNRTDIYLPAGSVTEQLLQGDGWQGFIAIRFADLARREVSGIILSNSCDIDPGNRRATPPSILFAPLISLPRYRELLLRSGQTPAQTGDTMSAIRSQKATSIFYLPNAPYGPAESIALLDDIHAHPLEDFLNRDRTRLFRLNLYGFYIFLVKLSIHFSRFQEGVKRLPA